MIIVVVVIIIVVVSIVIVVIIIVDLGPPQFVDDIAVPVLRPWPRRWNC